MSTLGALSTFAMGFLMRPIGAFVLGIIGDRYGRSHALSLSIILMGLPALIVAFTPSYASIGLMAPIIILFFRLLQGFSAGGEFNGAALSILEIYTGPKKALYSSLISAAGGLGALLALAVGVFINYFEFSEIAFRLAFLLGALVSLCGFLLRRKMQAIEIKEKPTKKVAKPLREIFRNQKKIFSMWSKCRELLMEHYLIA